MWSVKLRDSEIEALRVLVRSHGDDGLGDALGGALEALELARWDDLPEAELPWDELEALAAEQGVGVADVFWDRAGRVPEPAPPAGSKRAKARKMPRKKARK